MIELDEFELSTKEIVPMVCWFMVVYQLWGMAYFTVFILAVHVIRPGIWSSPAIYSTALTAFLLLMMYCMSRYCAFFRLPKVKMTFGDGIYRIVCEDGSKEQGSLIRIRKAEYMRGYYRLFMCPMFYYSVPITAFRSEEDRIRFETEILGDKLKRRSIPWKAIIIFLLVSACFLGLALMFRLTHYNSEAESKLDKLPQIRDNDGHGSDTYNNEFRPAGTDYGFTPGTPQSGSGSDRPAESGGI